MTDAALAALVLMLLMVIGASLFLYLGVKK
jgi:hypothetical protein